MTAMANKLDIPRHELTYAICITMPQCRLAAEYHRWAQEQPHDIADVPGLMIENVDEWIETNNYPDLVTWGSSFLRTRRPPLVICGVFGRKPKEQ